MSEADSLSRIKGRFLSERPISIELTSPGNFWKLNRRFQRFLYKIWFRRYIRSFSQNTDLRSANLRSANLRSANLRSG
ncbi:MAG: pentapeptide repeat-containing protein [Treponema sp.]|nr:pentapeptide repeat-containing protein [Treponema sp.]